MKTLTNFRVQCDNPKCEYKKPLELSQFKDYVNKPCPDCGENLLTERDYADMIVIIGLTTIEETTNPIDGNPAATHEMRVHNGDITLNPIKIER